MPSDLPDQIESYRIDGELGRGAMGVVFRAHHEFTQRNVALKVLFDHVAAHDVGVERFRREVSVSSRVEDPGIVEIYDAGAYRETFYYAMEMLEGRELEDVIPELTLRQRLELMVDVSRSLGACHRAGIVHRDLKPENIFVVDDPQTLTKIFDFGISSMRDAPRATATGNVVGTPVFMSPEQATDAAQVGPPADVWSMGVILYELTTGRLPIDADSSTQVLIKVAEADIERLEYTDAQPDALVDLINRCLAENPDERFQNGDDLHEALKPIVESMASSESARAPVLDSSRPIAPTHQSGLDSEIPSTIGLDKTIGAGGDLDSAADANSTPQSDASVSADVEPADREPDDASESDESAEAPAPTPSNNEPPVDQPPPEFSDRSSRRMLVAGLIICGVILVTLVGMVALLTGESTKSSTEATDAIDTARMSIIRATDRSQTSAEAGIHARRTARTIASDVHIQALKQPDMPDDATESSDDRQASDGESASGETEDNSPDRDSSTPGDNADGARAGEATEDEPQNTGGAAPTADGERAERESQRDPSPATPDAGSDRTAEPATADSPDEEQPDQPAASEATEASETTATSETTEKDTRESASTQQSDQETESAESPSSSADKSAKSKTDDDTDTTATDDSDKEDDDDETASDDEEKKPDFFSF